MSALQLQSNGALPDARTVLSASPRAKAGPRRERRALGAWKRRRGTASIELLICLLPVLLTFLAIVQYSLLFIGRLVVQHAAQRALRSAVVLLDDDPKRHGGAPRGDLVEGGADRQILPTSLVMEDDPRARGSASTGTAAETDSANATARTQQSLLDNLSSAENEDERAGARLTAIRRAAYMPLAVLAPPLAAFDRSNVEDAVSLSKIEQLGFGLLIYGRAASAITLHDAPGEEDPKWRFGPRDSVTTRVTFLMPCRVPLVSRIMCRSGWDLKLSGDLKRFDHVASKALHTLILTGNLRFMVLEAEASGINQGANYYPEENDG